MVVLANRRGSCPCYRRPAGPPSTAPPAYCPRSARAAEQDSSHRRRPLASTPCALVTTSARSLRAIAQTMSGWSRTRSTTEFGTLAVRQALDGADLAEFMITSVDLVSPRVVPSRSKTLRGTRVVGSPACSACLDNAWVSRVALQRCAITRSMTP